MSHLKILAVAGPSGGHIFPALGFLDSVKNRCVNTDLLLVLPKKTGAFSLQNPDYKTSYISITNLKLGLSPKNLLAVWNFFKGSLESLLIILKFRPSIVVGFGSLVSLPIILFARATGAKIIIHEQNIIPGRANKFLAGLADKIATSFTQTKHDFTDFSHKIILTGNPMRKELTRIDRNKALNFFGFSPDKFTILVMGGSAGSRRINLEFFKAITTFPAKERFQVIHLTGAADYDLLKNNYKGQDSHIRLFRFLESMQYAYSAADLVICRAGATTIAEIIFFKLPAILLPYPYAYKHQLTNAEFLGQIGSAMIIEDDEFDAAMLKLVIGELLNNPDRLTSMRSNLDGIFKFNAGDSLAAVALSLDNTRK